MKNNKDMLVLEFNFSVRTTKLHSDGVVAKLSKEIESYQAEPLRPAQLLFKARKEALLTELTKVSKAKGGLELSKLFAWKQSYIKREVALDNNYSDFNMNGFSKVYDNVVGSALSNKARELDAETATSWDEEIHDLNHEYGTFITPKQVVGSEWHEVKMVDLAPFKASYAGEGTKEPYAGTSAIDFF